MNRCPLYRVSDSFTDFGEHRALVIVQGIMPRSRAVTVSDCETHLYRGWVWQTSAVGL